jgi:hypothetical protein
VYVWPARRYWVSDSRYVLCSGGSETASGNIALIFSPPSTTSVLIILSQTGKKVLLF